MSKIIKLNLEDIKTLEGFHSYIIESFNFPLYYGKNKDAFWDCITDMIGDVTVEISGEMYLAKELRLIVGEYIEILFEYEYNTDSKFKVIRK
jgi:ribonuclease inhibitor